MRIGIYDPSLSPKGHFVSFNAYVAKLLAGGGNEVVVFGEPYMEGALRALSDPGISFVALPSRTAPRSRWLASFFVFRRALASIRAERLDALLFTSEARAGALYLFRPRLPYVQFVLWTDFYASKPGDGARTRLRRAIEHFLFRRWCKRAWKVVTTNEPTMQDGLYRVTGRERHIWLQNLPFDRSRRLFSRSDATADFVTLGAIADRKGHLFALDAFESEPNLVFSWIIAGQPKGEYGNAVVRKVNALNQAGDARVRGVFRYLSDEEYASLLGRGRWALLSYDGGLQGVSSQVLHDSLAADMPIIAPDTPLFRFYVETYGVGLLYKERDPLSFIDTIRRALREGPASYRANITRLRDEFSFDNIRKHFREQLALGELEKRG